MARQPAAPQVASQAGWASGWILQWVLPIYMYDENRSKAGVGGRWRWVVSQLGKRDLRGGPPWPIPLHAAASRLDKEAEERPQAGRGDGRRGVFRRHEGRTTRHLDDKRETTARTEAQTSAVAAAEKRPGSAQHYRAGKAHRQYPLLRQTPSGPVSLAPVPLVASGMRPRPATPTQRRNRQTASPVLGIESRDTAIGA